MADDALPSPLDALPHDLLVEGVLQLLDARSLCALSQASRSLYAACADSRLWRSVSLPHSSAHARLFAASGLDPLALRLVPPLTLPGGLSPDAAGLLLPPGASLTSLVVDGGDECALASDAVRAVAGLGALAELSCTAGAGSGRWLRALGSRRAGALVRVDLQATGMHEANALLLGLADHIARCSLPLARLEELRGEFSAGALEPLVRDRGSGGGACAVCCPRLRVLAGLSLEDYEFEPREGGQATGAIAALFARVALACPALEHLRLASEAPASAVLLLPRLRSCKPLSCSEARVDGRSCGPHECLEELMIECICEAAFDPLTGLELLDCPGWCAGLLDRCPNVRHLRFSAPGVAWECPELFARALCGLRSLTSLTLDTCLALSEQSEAVLRAAPARLRKLHLSDTYTAIALLALPLCSELRTFVFDDGNEEAPLGDILHLLTERCFRTLEEVHAVLPELVSFKSVKQRVDTMLALCRGLRALSLDSLAPGDLMLLFKSPAFRSDSAARSRCALSLGIREVDGRAYNLRSRDLRPLAQYCCDVQSLRVSIDSAESAIPWNLLKLFSAGSVRLRKLRLELCSVHEVAFAAKLCQWLPKDLAELEVLAPPDVASPRMVPFVRALYRSNPLCRVTFVPYSY
eukprot:m51a1_g11315 hypothetical protein (639) ;mRNA; f:101965-103881